MFIRTLLLFIISTSSFAYHAATGTYVPYFNKAQINDSGETQKFAFNPYISIGTQMQMSGPHFFLPEFGLTYFLENATNTKRDIIHLHYNFGYVLNADFLIRYGISNQWYRLHGEGGTQRLKNGNGTTTFKSPSKTVTTYFSTLNLGTEYMLPSKQYSVRFDFQVMSFKEFEDRVYNYLLTLNFYKF